MRYGSYIFQFFLSSFVKQFETCFRYLKVDLLFIYVKYSVASKINNITGNIEELIIHVACIYNCDLIYHFTPGENAVGQHHLAISRIVPTVLVYHFPHFSTFLAGQYLQIDRADGRSISSNSPETNARRRQFPFNTTMCAS